MKRNENRLANLELLRVVSMLMIILLHLLGKTSLLWEELPINSFSYAVCWFLYALCMTSVNCYVIISGYFLIDAKWKLKKAMNIYIQVLFYSVVLYIVAKYILRIELMSGFSRVILPITRREYWFATVYLGMYCLCPFINIFVNSLNKKQLQRFILVIALFFSVIPTIFYSKDWLGEDGAYGIGWFVFLYIIGAYIKTYGVEISKDKKWKYYWICILILPLSKLAVMLGGKFIDLVPMEYIIKGSEILFAFHTIPVLMAFVFLFLCFIDIQIKNTYVISIINWLGGATFGVYLLHNNRNIAHYMWDSIKVLEKVKNGEVWYIFVGGVGVLIICSVIEQIRKQIWKYIGINRLIEVIGDKVQNKMYSV